MYSHLLKYKVLTPPPFRLAGCNKFKPTPSLPPSLFSYNIFHSSTKRTLFSFPLFFNLLSFSQTIHHPKHHPLYSHSQNKPPSHTTIINFIIVVIEILCHPIYHPLLSCGARSVHVKCSAAYSYPSSLMRLEPGRDGRQGVYSKSHCAKAGLIKDAYIFYSIEGSPSADSVLLLLLRPPSHNTEFYPAHHRGKTHVKHNLYLYLCRL